MYNTAKSLHLFFSVVITPFLFFYAISALFFAHGFLDFSSSHLEQNKIVLQSVPDQTGDLLDMLSSEYGVDGRLSSDESLSNGVRRLHIFRPGVHSTISIAPDGETEIKSRVFNAIGFFKELHSTSGIDGEHASESWWAIAVQVAGISLLGLLISGLIMWAYRSPDRRGGLWFLGVSTLFCIVVIGVLRWG